MTSDTLALLAIVAIRVIDVVVGLVSVISCALVRTFDGVARGMCE